MHAQAVCRPAVVLMWLLSAQCALCVLCCWRRCCCGCGCCWLQGIFRGMVDESGLPASAIQSAMTSGRMRHDARLRGTQPAGGTAPGAYSMWSAFSAITLTSVASAQLGAADDSTAMTGQQQQQEAAEP